MAEAFVWVPTNALNCHRLEHKAVLVGREGHDTSPIYVGRCMYEGLLMPCKVIPRHNVAYVSHKGLEISVTNFELYCLAGPTLEWVRAYNGDVPAGAVEGGRSPTGEKLYIGRAYYKGSVTPGKIHSSRQCIFIPFGGKEVGVREYEVMTLKYR